MGAKICLISDLHLSTNPRLWKEANSLAASGYEVTIITVWTSKEKWKKDLTVIKGKGIQYKAGVNLIAGEINSGRRFYYRFRHRLAIELKRLLGLDSSWNLGYAPARLVSIALDEMADLYICHAEFGILLGKQLIEKGCRVGYDIEDWYSRDYLVPTRPVRLLEKLEAFAVLHGTYCTCPSQSMSDALGETYGGKDVQVIYNGFSLKETRLLERSNQGNVVKLVWFSQTIGEGRGLETLIEALKFWHELVELHLIGDSSIGYKQKLGELFPHQLGHKLIFHDPIPHADLIAELSQYDIGLALEQTYPDSRNVTITNKVLQYIQAGLKVLATETKGQVELATKIPGAFALVPQDKPEEWATALMKLANNPINREEVLNKFSSEFSWEAQESKFLSLVKKALEEPK